MTHDGSNPITEALGDTTQKGAALAAIAMQLLAEKHRADAAKPAASHGGQAQDYLSTQRRWNETFQLGFAQADGRTATRLWLEAAQHRELYPSAREAMELAGRRLRELDPAFMKSLEARLAGGISPVLALEGTAKERLQLPPAGRWSNDTVGADDVLAAQASAGNGQDRSHTSDTPSISRTDVPDLPYSVESVHREELGGDGDWYEQSRHETLGAAALEAQGLKDDGEKVRVKENGEVLDPAAVDSAFENEPALSLQEANRQIGLDPASLSKGQDFDPAIDGLKQARVGLAADEEHAGLVMRAAVDQPQTPNNERLEGLVNSGERFQVAEASQAHAASLTSLSYPHSVESTIAAVQHGPATRLPKTNQPEQRRGRSL